MTRSIHTFMQNTNDNYSIVCSPKVNFVPLLAYAAIAWPYVIACLRCLWRLRQFIKSRCQ